MDWRLFHAFLKWIWPALFGGIISLLALLVAASGVWPEAKDKTAEIISSGAELLNTPLIWFFLTVLIGIWLFLLFWSGRKIDGLRDDKEIARDASLASRAEELARDMLQESASLQRARMQRHWADDHVLGRDNWLGARRAEAVEQEGAAHRFGFRLESILAETRERGVHIKDWAVDRWGADDLRYWAKALLLIAGAARAGKLEGRTLRVSWHEQVLGTADELKKHDEERHRP